MGIDVLDLAYRIEKAFDIIWPFEVHQRMWEAAAKAKGRADLTAGELCDFIRLMLAEWNKPIPGDSWLRVQGLLGEMFDVAPETIQRDTHLRRDLGHD